MKILVIPDAQVMPGVDLGYIEAIGHLIVTKQPDIIVNLGDFADMPSLSSYDKGKKVAEGKRYHADVESVVEAQKILFSPLKIYNKNRRHKYKPRTIMLLGNHEDRIDRAANLDPAMFGTLKIEDLRYQDYWSEVYPFLQVVIVEGIAFAHYFTTGLMGRPATSAQAQLNKMHMSCISGHQQGRQTVTSHRADGRMITSIIAGSSYDYHMSYLGTQGNRHWRGVIMLHNVKDGQFDEVYIPTNYLKEKYL